MAPDRALTLGGSPPRKVKNASARSGAVWDPTGGPARFPAQLIFSRAEAHACLVGYGLRSPRGTYAISARSRPGLESRSRRDRVCASRPLKAVAAYLTVRSGFWRYL